MYGSQIRRRLRRGERVYGTHVVSIGNPITMAMTAELALDFVFICTEHMPVDRQEVSMMCQYYSQRGISPMVRIPCVSAQAASMYMDGGAQGIVVPYVETVDQVKDLVGAVKYRPIKGEFLRDVMSGMRTPAAKTKSFLERFNKNNYLIIMVESVAAVKNLDDLLAIDEVDGVLMGPHDLTCSMEIPEEYENPEFIKTVIHVIERCRQMGKGVGIHSDLTAETSSAFLKAGINLMIHVADIIKMKQLMGSDLAVLRETFGDDEYSPGQDTQGDIQTCIDQERK